MWLQLVSLALLYFVSGQGDGRCGNIVSSESDSESSFVSSSSVVQTLGCARDAFCDVETSTCVCKRGFIGDGVTCTPVAQCKRPGPVRNGDWTKLGEGREGNHIYPGDRLKYSCEIGYAIKRNNGTKIRTCTENGSWDLKKPPACVVAKCDAPDGIITNGNSTAVPGTKYSRGGIVEYSCFPGYRVKGSSWQSCISIDSLRGRWSDPPPTCEEIQCHDPGYPENSNRNGRPPFFVGDEVRFRCASGYTLIGSESRTCQQNGKWSGYLTICDSGVGDCRNPGSPINGRKVGRSYNVGDVVSFLCDTGFSMVGSKTRKCLDTGEWTGRQPTCRGAGDYDDPETVAESFGKKLDKFVEDTTSVRNTGNAAGRFIDLSYGGRLEIYIAIDSSASVTEKNFYRAVDFAKALVKKTGVSGKPKGPRYGALTYTKDVVQQFPVTIHTNQQRVLEELDQFTYHAIGGTATAKALLHIRSMISLAITRFRNEDEFATEPPKRVVILLTDGASNTGGDPIDAANDLKTLYDVEIYVIGIRVSKRNDELIGMASTELPDEHIFILQDYGELERLATLIVGNSIDYSVCGVGGITHEPMGRGRVSGGINVKEGAWPWQTAIWTSFIANGKLSRAEIHPFCGGSVISSKWILTAAHCFYGKLDGIQKNEWHKHIIVGLGYTDTFPAKKKPYTRLAAVKRIIIHEQYSNLDYDIALLELEKPIEFSNYIQPVCLPTPDTELPEIGNAMAITGWGNTERRPINGNNTYSQTQHLQQVYLNIIGRKKCAQDLSTTQSLYSITPRPLTENMFCVGGSRPSSCKGDSGGPVVKKLPANNERGERWVQFGIVSFGYGCAVDGQHDVMTNIVEFTDWIEQKTSLPLQ